jgi:hypothetical protein
VGRTAATSFAGYAQVINRLEDRLLASVTQHESSHRVTFVLAGMGGVGKSETVLQFLETNARTLRRKSVQEASLDVTMVTDYVLAFGVYFGLTVAVKRLLSLLSNSSVSAVVGLWEMLRRSITSYPAFQAWRIDLC